nr:DUF308 domain-containing protein [uncultured Blautia sp.]
MEEKKKKVFSGQIPTAVFYILFGLCLALMPVETVNVLCKVVFGLVLIGAGVYHIVIFVLEKDNSTILDLFSGVIVLVIGIFLFMNPTVVVKLLTLMLGAFILVDSIWMLRGSLKLKKRKQGVWKSFLVESLIFIGLGALILVNPFSEIKMTVQVSGYIFVANGVLDIIFYFLLKHGLKKEIAPDGKVEKMESEKTSGSDAQVGKEDVTIREEASVRENVEAREEASVRENVEAREEAAADTTVREDAAESVSEDQNGQNTNADADTVRKEPQEEVLEEWKD